MVPRVDGLDLLFGERQTEVMAGLQYYHALSVGWGKNQGLEGEGKPIQTTNKKKWGGGEEGVLGLDAFIRGSPISYLESP